MYNKDVQRKEADTLTKNNQILAASHIYEQICSMDEEDADAWATLGDLYQRLKQRNKAVSCYKKAVALVPDDAVFFHKLAIIQHAMGALPEAFKCYQQALNLNPGGADIYFHLGNLFNDQSNPDQAGKMYRQCLQLDPNHARAHCCLGHILRGRCRIDEAIAQYQRALELNPGLTEAKWSKLRILPIIYKDTDELEKYRKRYAEGLRQLNIELSLDNRAEREAALWGAAVTTTFQLQYQGRDDLLLQKAYGELVQRIMAASFPQWSKPVMMPPLRQGERIRIGYASSFLRAHNGALWLLGWLRHRDKNRFEVYCYYTGGKIDEKTKKFMEYSDHFYHIPGNLVGPCNQIVADNLHVLVYPELGMYAPTQFMAGLYLAPVQCTSWGHPITSGFATIDYYLSSDLMEPVNGHQHYTETLVRLPNLAINYSRSQSDSLKNRPLDKRRSDFNLREDAILYFCCQSLFKYLPEYDFLFPAIAHEVPNAQFVFITVLNEGIEDVFIRRIRRTFLEAGLNADDYCVVLPRLSQDDYVTLNRLVDVFLDNPSWSGANTTLIAVDCDLPVVTWPTAFMRGRHSYAILKMMGIADTVADSAEEYVRIAVQLGVNTSWRHAMVRKIKETKHKLYDDIECVKGLETFYESAVRGR